jgi:hypothetical protein
VSRWTERDAERSLPGAVRADMLAEIEDAIRVGRIIAFVLDVTFAPIGSVEVTPRSFAPPPKTTETDFIDVLLTNGFEHPFEEEPYVLTLQDGTVIEDKLDGKGRLRKEGVRFGSFTLEFPQLFGMTVIRDGHRIHDPGRGAPHLLPAPPEPIHHDPLAHYAVSGRSDWLEHDDDDDDDDDVEMLASDGGDAWPEVFDGPKDDDAPDVGRLDVQQRADLADLSGLTGCEYHLAVLYCVSVRLVDEKTGAWVRKPTPYSLSEASGKRVAAGESKDGIVFCDETAMGAFVLEIGGKKHAVTATPHAHYYDIVAIEAWSAS